MDPQKPISGIILHIISRQQQQQQDFITWIKKSY